MVFSGMQGCTAVYNAAFHNEAETVQMLLRCGADATARDNRVHPLL